MPGVAPTVNMEHIKGHYYRSHKTINPTGVVPLGPEIDFAAPHDRDRFPSALPARARSGFKARPDQLRFSCNSAGENISNLLNLSRTIDFDQWGVSLRGPDCTHHYYLPQDFKD